MNGCVINVKRTVVQEEKYVSEKGKNISAKTMKPPCSHRMKCYERISKNERVNIFNSYWNEKKSIDILQFVRGQPLYSSLKEKR
jgi:hypothetical protein